MVEVILGIVLLIGCLLMIICTIYDALTSSPDVL